jgi:hypothetical protein
LLGRFHGLMAVDTFRIAYFPLNDGCLRVSSSGGREGRESDSPARG